jgi:hypothetical protein
VANCDLREAVRPKSSVENEGRQRLGTYRVIFRQNVSRRESRPQVTTRQLGTMASGLEVTRTYPMHVNGCGHGGQDLSWVWEMDGLMSLDERHDSGENMLMCAKSSVNLRLEAGGGRGQRVKDGLACEIGLPSSFTGRLQNPCPTKLALPWSLGLCAHECRHCMAGASLHDCGRHVVARSGDCPSRRHPRSRSTASVLGKHKHTMDLVSGWACLRDLRLPYHPIPRRLQVR